MHVGMANVNKCNTQHIDQIVFSIPQHAIHITSKIETKLLFSHLAPSALERH